jgi:hypothetical protein
MDLEKKDFIGCIIYHINSSRTLEEKKHSARMAREYLYLNFEIKDFTPEYQSFLLQTTPLQSSYIIDLLRNFRKAHDDFDHQASIIHFLLNHIEN